MSEAENKSDGNQCHNYKAPLSDYVPGSQARGRSTAGSQVIGN